MNLPPSWAPTDKQFYEIGSDFTRRIHEWWADNTEEHARLIAVRMCQNFGQDPEVLVSRSSGPPAVSRFGHRYADLDLYPAWVWFYPMTDGLEKSACLESGE